MKTVSLLCILLAVTIAIHKVTRPPVMEATYFSPKLAGHYMKNGERYDPSDLVCRSSERRSGPRVLG